MPTHNIVAGWASQVHSVRELPNLGVKKCAVILRMQSTSRIALHLVKVSRPIPSVWNVALGCVKGLDSALIKSARVLATEM